jgi:hypothetical protein
VSYPPIVPGIYMRNVRMTLLVHFHVILIRGPGFLSSCRSRSARRRGSPRGSRTARRNVSTANRRVTAASVRLATVLPESSHANENR